ncbi:MAG: hypothetical protein A3F69_03790 [Acidobacteria bacterium RIFCSPLOWO2_12_FULL_66_10]|nr:MAG: hypothetical protein A3F69_03790 [Acidobacteria bacterium RIFCSPLOWO2_12_FULL_66_10]
MLQNSDDADDLPLGSHVGPYIVIDRLGQGGMGQVFLGTDPRLHRKVALKCLIRSQWGSRDDRARILQEARAGARISHPNVAHVHDIIEEGPRAFIVLEYVEGESLQARLHRGRLPPEGIVTVGRQLASALAAAHKKGVVHRDLKPANIQVTPDGSVKVLDFGIAKAMAPQPTATLTNPARDALFHAHIAMPGPDAGAPIVATLGTEAGGAQPGTPAYMSPEQWFGRDVDERSDVFSLGIILFEMATGRVPPLGMILASAGPLPRADAIDPQVPRPLADVIARTLEIDRQNRFQSAAALESALDALEHGRELPAAIFRRPEADRTVSLGRTLLRGVTTAGAVVVGVGLLGLVNSAAFNVTLERSDAFAQEPRYAYLVWGIRSVIAPAVYIAAVIIVVWASRFLVRLLRLIRPIDRPLRGSLTSLEAFASTIGLNDPTVLAQALAMAGVLALGVIGWRYVDLIVACTTKISMAAPADMLPLGPDHSPENARYGIALSVVALSLGLGLLRVIRLRARLGIRDDNGTLAAAGAVLALTVLMYELPYRVMWQNQFQKIQWSGARCYVIGEAADQWLIHCPDQAPPRNRVIRRDDQAVRTVGIRESIFTPGEPGAR